MIFDMVPVAVSCVSLCWMILEQLFNELKGPPEYLIYIHLYIYI